MAACHHAAPPRRELIWASAPGCASAPQESQRPAQALISDAAALFTSMGMPVAQIRDARGPIVVIGGPSSIKTLNPRFPPAAFRTDVRVTDNSAGTSWQIGVRSAEPNGVRFTSADSIAITDAVLSVCVQLMNAMRG